jgi:hypothetical protein
MHLLDEKSVFISDRWIFPIDVIELAVEIIEALNDCSGRARRLSSPVSTILPRNPTR